MSDASDYSTTYALIDSLFLLPVEPWPEPYREILLKIGDFYRVQDGAPQRAYYIFKDAKLDDGQGLKLYQLLVWQSDKRSLPFWDEFGVFLYNIQSPQLPYRKVATEAIVDHTIKILSQEESLEAQNTIVRMLRSMINEQYLFSYEPAQKQQVRRRRIREALFKAAQSPNVDTRHEAIRLLIYFPNDQVEEFLLQVSRTDPHRVEGQYPIRQKARDILGAIHDNVCPY